MDISNLTSDEKVKIYACLSREIVEEEFSELIDGGVLHKDGLTFFMGYYGLATMLREGHLKEFGGGYALVKKEESDDQIREI